MRTTGLQVSGYNFLLRRLELALVTGDPRMAHDPLRNHRRSLFVGVLISLLIAGAGVMLSLLRPAPSLDGENLVADESGALHVRLGEAFHPVTNVASARLVLKAPEEVHKTTAEHLAQLPLGEPIGIMNAPSLVAAPTDRHWLYCEPRGVVVAAQRIREYRFGILSAPNNETWFIDGSRRHRIDASAARVMGAPAVNVSPGFVEQFDRGPDVALPSGPTGLPAPFDAAGKAFRADGRLFIAAPGGVAEVTGLQRSFAEGMIAEAPAEVPLSQILAQPSAGILSALPKQERVEWASPERPCVGENGLAEVAAEELTSTGHRGGSDAGAAKPVPEVLSGQNPGHFIGPRGTSALLTERGYVLISDNGVRYSVGTAEEFEALGFQDTQKTSWRRIAGLPDGGLLTEGRARAITATTQTSANKTPSTSGTV